MPSTIAVTGASGFIATELVAQLLARGDTVRGTVRSLAPERTAHLTSLPGASERLTLFAADLLDGAGAFAEAFAGCSVVMHTACPFVPLGRAKELGEEVRRADAARWRREELKYSSSLLLPSRCPFGCQCCAITADAALTSASPPAPRSSSSSPRWMAPTMFSLLPPPLAACGESS